MESIWQTLPSMQNLIRPGTRFLLSLTAIAAFMMITGCRTRETSTASTVELEDYKTAREHFKTKLLHQGPAPQFGDSLRAPSGALQIEYSTGPSLKAWITPPPVQKNGRKQPAVLFLHGGFAIGEEDWEMAQPYQAAGFAVMMPVLRAENGQGGAYSMFYNEINDVLAARNYLAKQHYIDASHIYLAGHSVGGSITQLAAMTTNGFRAAASFSGSPDQVAWSKPQPEVIPFDPADTREFEMRSPIKFATSFKCPARLFYGDQEGWCSDLSQKTAALAKGKGLDVEAISVPGDHFSAVPEAMRQSIEFFQANK